MTEYLIGIAILMGGIVAMQELRPPRWVWLTVIAGAAVAALVYLHLHCPACQRRWTMLRHRIANHLAE